MSKLLSSVLLFIGALNLCFAYEMHGTLNDNNDGTYQVNIVSSSGREYLGLADEQGDGTLDINVAIQGGGSEIYLGIAKPNSDGSTYILHLKNNTTGEIATGSLEKSS